MARPDACEPTARPAAASTCGVILIAAGAPYYRLFRFPTRHALLHLMAAIKVVTPLLGYFPRHRLGFAGREPRSLMREWAGFAWSGRLIVGQQEVLRPRSDAPEVAVHAFSLARDSYAPIAATEHLLACAELPAANIERVQDPGVQGHFGWLRAPHAAASLIAGCMQSLQGHR